MKLTTKEDSLNYQCTVVEIKHLYDIEGADKIKRTVIEGNDIIVGLDTKIGDKMLWFCTGTQLSHEFCKKNNLYDNSEQNEDVSKKGYISFKKRLVKIVKLRGIDSNGFLLPISAISSDLKTGDTFNYVDDILICQKYFVPVKEKVQNKSETKPKKHKLTDILIENQFKFHGDTSHFAKNIHKFSDSDLITITRKYHGSSGIVAKVLIKTQFTRYQKVLNWFGANLPKSHYGLIFSSGKPKSNLPKGIISNIVTWNTLNPNFYSENIWAKAAELLKDKVEKGITLYFEIIGKGIQGDQYTYNKDYELIIYKITTTNVDGNTINLGWQELKNYCEKYNLIHVQEYFYGTWKELKTKILNTKSNNSEIILDKLKNVYLNKSYSDCKVDEGVVIENLKIKEKFKLKSPNFLLNEAKQLENDIVNIEDNE